MVVLFVKRLLQVVFETLQRIVTKSRCYLLVDVAL